MTVRVVLDTNVVVSALLKPEGLEDKVLKLALHGRFQPCASTPILTEYERVLAYPRLAIPGRLVREFLAEFGARALHVEPATRLSEYPHEADNRFLECAEACGADFLVTGNRRHYPSRWKRTRILPARELLLLYPPWLL